jgi:hypothetical protein
VQGAGRTRASKSGDLGRGGTHPEHGLRAYAAWLFSETKHLSRVHRAGPWDPRHRGRRRGHRAVLRTPRRHRPRPAPGRRGSARVPRVCAGRRGDGRPRRRGAQRRRARRHRALVSRPRSPTGAATSTAMPRLARFLDTATVLARSALEVAPQVFLNLLVEVMLSDREVHPSEIGRVAERSALRSARSATSSGRSPRSSARGGSSRRDSVAAPEEPLPARRPARRRCLPDLPRRRAPAWGRLDHLAPVAALARLRPPQRGPGPQARRAFGHHRVTVMPALATAGLDERLALTPASPTSAGPASAALPGVARRAGRGAPSAARAARLR